MALSLGTAGAMMSAVPFAHIGCYIDNPLARALPQVVYTSQNTHELCAFRAASSGASFFGVANGDQCWTGDSFNIQSAFTSEDACDGACAGNATQHCGHVDRLQLFRLLDAKTKSLQRRDTIRRRQDGDDDSWTPPPASPASPAASCSCPSFTNFTSTPTPTPSGYTALGCFSDNVNGRALPGYFGSNQMTPTSCFNTAVAAGAIYFGVEYGSECWYGTVIGGGNGPVAMSDCDAACSGDANAICGSGNRLSMYKIGASSSSGPSGTGGGTNSTGPSTAGPTGGGGTSTPGTSLGCYYDNAYGVRALPNVYVSGSMTVKLCASRAKFSGAAYYGLEYSSECWYGNSIASVNGPAASADCNAPCAGNKDEVCGAGNRLSMYSL